MVRGHAEDTAPPLRGSCLVKPISTATFNINCDTSQRSDVGHVRIQEKKDCVCLVGRR